jgi:RNA methyltransferase, TrmH family
MLSKKAIKYINSLKIKKYRQQYKSFIVEGDKSVTELLGGSIVTKAVYCTESWKSEHAELLSSRNIELYILEESDLPKISDLSTPNKVLAVASVPALKELTPADYEDMILVLDGIRDPGNMGTILRTADWFGIRNIVCSLDSVDVFNPKVVQATMGSFARVNVLYVDLLNFMAMVPKSTPVYGALLEGPPLTDKKFIKPGILIIGNESQGISSGLVPHISDPVFIPPFPPGIPPSYHAESLNASVANAIICYEIRKQLFENKF